MAGWQIGPGRPLGKRSSGLNSIHPSTLASCFTFLPNFKKAGKAGNMHVS